MEKLLQGQTAIVTGSSSGIGKAIAIALAEAGANIVVNYHSGEQRAAEVVKIIEAQGGKAIMVQADTGNEAEVKNLFQKTIDAFGNIDILVNNAGIQQDSAFAEMSIEQWQKVIDTNLTGYFMCAQQAVQFFLKRQNVNPAKAIGKIIFISSVHDVIPWAGHVNYASSKGGVSMLMKSMALELAPKKIRINAISPGAIKTHINEAAWKDPENEKKLLKLIPYKRVGEPEDVAKVALWLASDDSDYVTGTTIYVDGGMLLYPGFTDNG